MAFDYEGKVAVVTGGASGIGRSAAIAFARRGSDVVLADVNEERLESAAADVEATGRRALPVRCDVSRDDDVERLAETTLAELQRVDVVMNNAGVAIRGPVEAITMDDWRWIVDINLLSVVRGTRAFLPHLLGTASSSDAPDSRTRST